MLNSIHFGNFELDSARNLRETDEEIVVPAILERESILQYGNLHSYRSAAELKAAAFTLEGAWIVAYRHTPFPYIVDRADIRGRVKNVVWVDETNSLKGDLVFSKSLCDAELLDKLRAGTLNKDTSTAYFCNELYEVGDFGGQKYDTIQKNLMFHHIAVGIPEGRCPSPYVGLMDSFNDFLRVTIRPQHLFVRLTTVVVSAIDGVYALVGKLRQGTKETVTCEYMFDSKKEWTQERAEAYAKEQLNAAESSSKEKPRTVEVKKLDPFEVLAESGRILNSR
jgi:hypothetical protein